MNWYKTAIENQTDFPFFKDMPEQKATPVEGTEEFQKLLKRTPDIVQNLLDNCKDIQEATKTLKLYKFKFKVVEDIISININDKVYIIDDMLELKDPYDWIWSISDSNLDHYVNYPDPNKEFWDNPVTVYHATLAKYWPTIQKIGLEARDETRGINNRSTGAGVFTSDNTDDIGSYGDMIIEINAPQMKADGYMPEVSKEEPIMEAEKREALANIIGLQEFNVEVEAGIWPNTIIFFGDIPPKYLKELK